MKNIALAALGLLILSATPLFWGLMYVFSFLEYLVNHSMTGLGVFTLIACLVVNAYVQGQILTFLAIAVTLGLGLTYVMGLAGLIIFGQIVRHEDYYGI